MIFYIGVENVLNQNALYVTRVMIPLVLLRGIPYNQRTSLVSRNSTNYFLTQMMEALH